MKYRNLPFLLIFFTVSLLGNQAEHLDDLGPLPPIETLSLNAPLQMNEGNETKQKLRLKNSPAELTKKLEEKKFPFLTLAGLLLAGAIYAFVTIQKKRMIPQVTVSPMTNEERLRKAREIVQSTGEILSDREANELFFLLDPLVETLPEPQKYLILSEQAKFAGHKLRKTDITFV